MISEFAIIFPILTDLDSENCVFSLFTARERCQKESMDALNVVFEEDGVNWYSLKAVRCYILKRTELSRYKEANTPTSFTHLTHP